MVEGGTYKDKVKKTLGAMVGNPVNWSLSVMMPMKIWTEKKKI